MNSLAERSSTIIRNTTEYLETFSRVRGEKKSTRQNDESLLIRIEKPSSKNPELRRDKMIEPAQSGSGRRVKMGVTQFIMAKSLGTHFLFKSPRIVLSGIQQSKHSEGQRLFLM